MHWGPNKAKFHTKDSVCLSVLNTIQLSSGGQVNSVEHIPRREASRYISSAVHRL